MQIDFDRLRRDLLNYYGTAMMSASPMAMMNVIDVEHADERRLIKLAEDAGIRLDAYLV